MVRQFFPDHPLQWAKDNGDRFGILLMRWLLALVWLSQGAIKLISRNSDPKLDHNEFLGQLIWMKDTNPISLVVTYLDTIIIPNYEIFLILVITTELYIGISLAIGLFTRLASVVGGLMTVQLWILTLGWDEWLWTYPLIFMPHVLFFFARSGRDVGFDRVLAEKNSITKKLS